jgi:hypothetical protein
MASVDLLALKLARLLPRSPSLEPRGSRGSSGSVEDTWNREDQATIAAAFGSWVQGSRRRRFPALVCTLRVLPEWRFSPDDARLLELTTQSLLWEAFEPFLPRVPKREREELVGLMERWRIAELLHDELRHPAACHRCRGYGKVVSLSRQVELEAEATKLPVPLVIECPVCHGHAQGQRGYKARAKRLGWRGWSWGKYGNEVYTGVLNKHIYLSDVAAEAIIEKFARDGLRTEPA